MLDVHPPHHTPHGWRDFFIHIATISVGLLIAIGLEQTVEAIHHHHQRVELEHDLRLETEKNVGLYKLDYTFFDLKAAHFIGLQHYVDALRRKEPQSTLSKIPLPPGPVNDLFWGPGSSAWETAKESSLLELLPPDEAAMYHDLYFQHETVNRYAEYYFRAEAQRRRFESRFQSLTTPVKSGETLEPMGPDDLKQYSALVVDALDALNECRFLTDLDSSASDAVLAGAKSPDEVERAAANAQHLGNPPKPK